MALPEQKLPVKKRGRKLTNKEQRKLENDIRTLIGKDYSDFEIMERLELQPHILQQYQQRISDIDTGNFHKLNRVKVYSDYVLKSRVIIKELDEVKKKFSNRGQFTALVAAIKEKREVYKDVIKLGQDLGFIEKKANMVKLEGEISFSNYSKDEIKAEIEKEMLKLEGMASGNVIEMRPELLESTGDSLETTKRFLPSSVKVLEPTKKNKTSFKRKTKLTLRY